MMSSLSEAILPSISILVYFFISLILFWRGTLLVKWLLSKTWQGFQSIYQSLSGNLSTKVICLAVAGIFIPFTINSIIQPLARFTFSFLIGLSTELISGGNEVLQACQFINEREIPRCILSVISTPFLVFVDNFSQALGSSRLEALPFGRFIFFFAIWIIFVELSNRFQGHSKNSEDGSGRLLDKIISDPVLSSNIAFFSILVIGLYLSIASIATIPSLQTLQVAQEEASVERLEQRLEDTVNQFRRRFASEEDGFDQSFNPLVRISLEENNPLQPLREHLETVNLEQDFAALFVQQEIISEVELPNDKHDEFNSRIQSFYRPYYYDSENMLNTAQFTRENLINQANLMLGEAKKEVDEIKRSAITEYEFSNVDRKGNRETIDHFILISNWFDKVLSSKEAHINQCISSIQNLDREYGNTVTIFKGRLQVDEVIARNVALDVNSLYQSPSREDRWYQRTVDNISGQERNAREACRLGVIGSLEIPERPELGANFGPFRFVASWLLKTESLSLALITGLLGFGLLGAACSSFVRERIIPDISRDAFAEASASQINPQPLVKDLAKVIVIGLSAAILAFLSVVGGRAISF